MLIGIKTNQRIPHTIKEVGQVASLDTPVVKSATLSKTVVIHRLHALPVRSKCGAPAVVHSMDNHST
jgi:hypothetical protein